MKFFKDLRKEKIHFFSVHVKDKSRNNPAVY